jgi:hypothetical protein
LVKRHKRGEENISVIRNKAINQSERMKQIFEKVMRNSRKTEGNK